MEVAQVAGEKRPAGGRHANDRLRKRGMVPAVIYGHKKAAESVAISLHDLELAVGAAHHVVSLTVDNQQTQYLVKEVQYDHLQKTPIHVDLMRVNPDERVHVKVSIDFKGEPKNGVLMHDLSEFDVECPVLEIPDTIRVRVDQLGGGDSLHVKDIHAPEGVKILNDPNAVVVSVHVKRVLEETEVAEGAEEGAEASAEPEVIGRPAKDESEGEG